MRVHDILVPTDFSPTSTAAWRYALAVARSSGSRIHVIHVIAPPYLYDKWAGPTMPRTVAEFLVQAKRAAHAQLAALVPRRGRLARRVTTQVTSGSTVEDILKAIRARRADLVVMGTHGRSLMGQVFLGRTAERVIARSPVPVLTVRARRGR